jgi:hypothetical protein
MLQDLLLYMHCDAVLQQQQAAASSQVIDNVPSPHHSNGQHGVQNIHCGRSHSKTCTPHH